MARFKLEIDADSAEDMLDGVKQLSALIRATSGNTGETNDTEQTDAAPKASRTRAGKTAEPKAETVVGAIDNTADPADGRGVALNTAAAAVVDPFAAPIVAPAPVMEAPKTNGAAVVGIDEAKAALTDFMGKKGPLAAQNFMKTNFATGKLGDIPADRLAEFVAKVRAELG